MKTILLIITIAIGINANAQVTKVSLQASGLTCSMCSNSINKALKNLSFVDRIDANIETSTFDITFKPGSNVDFNALKKKVEDAGFSVANFVATIQFSGIEIKSNEVVTFDGNKFMFVNVKGQFLNGSQKIKFIDRGFVPGKEYKKLAALTIASGIKDVYLVTIS